MADPVTPPSDVTEPIIQYAKTNLLEYGIGAEATASTIGTNCVVYLQNITLNSEGDVKTYKDNVGQTTALIIPEQYQTLSCDGLLIKSQSAMTMPKKGDAVTNIPTVAGLITTGITFRLESCSVIWSNEDVAKLSMTVRGYPF